MRFVVLGATGATGRRVVEHAAAAGHEVVAYARRPHAVPALAGVEVVGGSMDDVPTLTDAMAGADEMAGADAVICCLGPGMRPATLVHVDVLQQAVPAIIAAMRQSDVRHLVIMSAFGVADTESKASLPARLAYRTLVRAAYADKERIERPLADAELEVTTVYPVALTNGPAKGTVKVVPLAELGDVGGIPTVSRGDVAAVLVDLAEHPTGASRRLFVG